MDETRPDPVKTAREAYVKRTKALLEHITKVGDLRVAWESARDQHDPRVFEFATAHRRAEAELVGLVEQVVEASANIVRKLDTTGC